MDFILSKHILSVIYPLVLCLWVAILSVLIAVRKKKTSLVFLFASFALFLITSTPAFSAYLLSSLERQYLPVPIAESPTADAIVVLGGSVAPMNHPRVEVELTDASDRILHAARLYRENKAPILVTTGGAVNSMPEAHTMSLLLQEWGVPASAILTETESLNTYRNAINTKVLLDERGLMRVLLVTSATHMPRALATFHSVGINAIPSPTDYGVVDKDDFSLLDFLPEVDAFRGTLRALNEYLGILAYRLRGWIK